MLGVAAIVVLGAAIAAGVSKGHWLVTFGLIAIGAFSVIGMHNWRLSIYALLLYMPVSGIAITLSASNTGLAALIKDILFVIPAYVSFALATRGRGWRVPGAPLLAIVVLASLVIVEAFNPSLPNGLVALIGTKVWLFYIPLLFLGYHFLRSQNELRSLLGLMTAAAMVPAVVGIVEAITIYSGHASQVYSLYGSAAASVTQQFARQDYLGGGSSLRIPSTFSFEGQYFGFLASMVAVAFAWWRMSGRRVRGAIACTILLAACFTSGARAAFIMIPFLIVLIVLFDRRLGQGSTILLAGTGALIGAAVLFGADPATVFGTAVNVGVSESQGNFLPDMKTAITTAALGLGTGYSTLSARYALVGQIDPRSVIETWYAKAILELGILGLLTVLTLFAQLVARAYRIHRRLADSGLRAFASAVIAFFIWNLIYMTKGGWIDIDPINVYFWLFAGIVLRLPTFDRDPHFSTPPPSREASPLKNLTIG